ncbi:GNAT family N-acetyltransferase [Winogradskyella sp. HB-48]|uniref:GNAT family N-acetyltransferase n=1 Tax=Winogradskyella sp. HB-48 TaxID=3416808 RepID=UPI003CE9E1D0
MKICIAQTLSEKGNIQKNIQNHLKFIERGITYKADLIIFPELSITNYEPQLAKALATKAEDKLFNPFQEVSDQKGIVIGVGIPTKATNGIQISLLIFQPNKERVVYSKQLLHEDELSYFVKGERQNIFTIKGKKIAFGICYETLQEAHFVNTIKNGADVYIASVAKPQNGINKANEHFPKMAKTYSTPVLMSNCVGACDDFMSVGQSAVWNAKGESVSQLDATNQGILIYDIETEQSEREQLTIDKGNLTDLDVLFQIYKTAKDALENNKIYQWTNNYPTSSIIENDLKDGVLYVIKNNDRIIGAINISENQEPEYKTIDWQFNDTKVLVIHRLVIHTTSQNKGFAKLLMEFAEELAKQNNFTSIRLDAYSQNGRVVEFYKNRNYITRGEIFFPERKYSFYAMEKEITKHADLPKLHYHQDLRLQNLQAQNLMLQFH